MCHMLTDFCTASLQRAIHPNAHLHTQTKLQHTQQSTQHVQLCILHQPHQFAQVWQFALILQQPQQLLALIAKQSKQFHLQVSSHKLAFGRDKQLVGNDKHVV